MGLLAVICFDYFVCFDLFVLLGGVGCYYLDYCFVS